MNLWLTLACVLASLSGTFSFYAAISVGSDGLVTMSNNLKSLSTVVASYSTTLNAARTKLYVGLNDVMSYANITYTALNKTYGSTQPNLVSFVQNVQQFNQTVESGEQSINSMIGSDLGQLSQHLQSSIDAIFQNYNMLLMGAGYQAKGDSCIVRNATQLASIPNSLNKLGPCLQVNINTINAIVPTAMNMIATAKVDLVTFNNLLKICSPASTRCINEYFTQIWSHWSFAQQGLYMLQSLFMSVQYDVQSRNRMCGELVKADIQDQHQNFQNSFYGCVYV